MANSPTLLVTGASGQLGRRVIQLLVETGAQNLIAGTRKPENLADIAAQGVTVRHVDFDDAASMAAAFTGVDRLLLISTDVVGVPGARQQQHLAAVQAAAKAGVKHIIYTSLVNPVETPVTLAPDHAATEAALAATQMGWTILRNNIYADSLPQTLKQAQQFGGQLFSAVGTGRIAWVTRDDCARAAAAALVAGFDGQRVLNITGPEALSQVDLAQMGSQLTGQPITYVPLPAEVLSSNLAGAGLPPAIVDLIVSFDTASAQGKFESVSNDFESLTGHKATRVVDFLTGALATV